VQLLASCSALIYLCGSGKSGGWANVQVAMHPLINCSCSIQVSLSYLDRGNLARLQHIGKLAGALLY
jgi:hypothetical protein